MIMVVMSTNVLFGVFYADDIILLSASVAGLQVMLSICDSTLADLQQKFNTKKCFCICPRHKLDVSPMNLGGDNIMWVDSIKYLGMCVRVGLKMTVINKKSFMLLVILY